MAMTMKEVETMMDSLRNQLVLMHLLALNLLKVTMN